MRPLIYHTPHHGNSAGHVIRESVRLYPLDLPERLTYLRNQAYACTNEETRHTILTHVARLRNGA
jgi:hypothetical protein